MAPRFSGTVAPSTGRSQLCGHESGEQACTGRAAATWSPTLVSKSKGHVAVADVPSFILMKPPFTSIKQRSCQRQRGTLPSRAPCKTSPVPGCARCAVLTSHLGDDGSGAARSGARLGAAACIARPHAAGCKIGDKCAGRAEPHRAFVLGGACRARRRGLVRQPLAAARATWPGRHGEKPGMRGRDSIAGASCCESGGRRSVPSQRTAAEACNAAP